MKINKDGSGRAPKRPRTVSTQQTEAAQFNRFERTTNAAVEAHKEAGRFSQDRPRNLDRRQRRWEHCNRLEKVGFYKDGRARRIVEPT